MGINSKFDNDFLKTLLSQIGEATILFDLEGNIIQMNPVAEQLLKTSFVVSEKTKITKFINIAGQNKNESFLRYSNLLAPPKF